MWCISLQVKKYPGYDFIGLIFGSGADTHKRLEKVRALLDVSVYKYIKGTMKLIKWWTLRIAFHITLLTFVHVNQETGARIRIYGIKAETGEKVNHL